MQEILPFFMVTAVTGIVAAFGIAFLNFLLKRRIIKSGNLDENYLRLLKKEDNIISALKWGIILSFSGIGLLLIGFLPFDPETSPIPYGIEIICVGLGFLTYYLLIRKEKSL